jgi:hypothetical protein
MLRMLRLAAVIVTLAPAATSAARAADGDDHSYLPPSMRNLPTTGEAASQTAQLANAGTDKSAQPATKDRRTKTEHDGGFLSHIFRPFRFAWDR